MSWRLRLKLKFHSHQIAFTLFFLFLVFSHTKLQWITNTVTRWEREEEEIARNCSFTEHEWKCLMKIHFLMTKVDQSRGAAAVTAASFSFSLLDCHLMRQAAITLTRFTWLSHSYESNEVKRKWTLKHSIDCFAFSSLYRTVCDTWGRKGEKK